MSSARSARSTAALIALAATGCGSAPANAPPPSPPPAVTTAVPSPSPIAAPASSLPPEEALPLGKPEAGQELARFHAALDAAASGQRADHVRILWLGDSHAAADFWSGRLRDKLQDRFGNGGGGFVHLGYRDYRHSRAKIDITGKWRMRPKPPTTTEPSGDGAFGLGGILMGGYAESPWVKLLPTAAPDGPTRYDFCYKLRNPHDRLEVRIGDGDRIELAPTEDAPVGSIQHYEAETASPEAFQVRYAGGSADLCGLVIEAVPQLGRAGVVVDTLGINGARYGTALAWSAEAWQTELARRDPTLVILEYGGNEAGDFAPQPDAIGASVDRMMERVRAVAPAADCLVISPTDRADAEERVGPIRDAVRDGAARSGCFFYDAYEILGGKGSLAKLREEPSPLAHEDGIHLTPKGYRKMGDDLFEAILRAR